MATFTSFQETLPSPSNSIGTAGQSTGTAGVGFKSVQLSSIAPIMRDRANSGRLSTRAQLYHKFTLKIAYNPLTSTDFNRIFSFLIEKQGSLKPFFIELPQSTGGTNHTTDGVTAAGSQTINTSTDNTPSIGSIFTVTDSSNTNHTKAYMVTRVETNSDYNTNLGQPGSGKRRIHIVPGLQKSVTSGSTLNFNKPLIKVIQKSDNTSYSLDQNNLYNFSLDLEEVST